MLKLFPRLVPAACAALLGGCLTGTSDSANAKVKIEPCEALKTLAASYDQQFADIRRAKRSHNRIDIWSTSYQIVGSGCEIWGWQGGNYNYVCHYVAPDKDAATAIYQEARTTIDQCLPHPWSEREEALPSAEGRQAVFKKPGFAGVIDLRLLETRGINTPRWAVYLMIGDYNSQI